MMAGASRYRDTLLAALIVLPLLVMSIFPQGTMATDGAHGFEVVLCTGDGPLRIHIDENGTPIDDQHVDAAGCGWWLLGQGLVLTASPETNCPAPRLAQKITTVEHSDAILPGTPSHYPARAPPLV